MSPNTAQILALITQSGERLFHGSDGSGISDYYSGLALRPEEFPIIVGVFNNIQDYLAWKRGELVKCHITLLYHKSQATGLELLAEADNLSFSGARMFADAA